MRKGFWMNNIPMTREEKEAVDRPYEKNIGTATCSRCGMVMP